VPVQPLESSKNPSAPDESPQGSDEGSIVLSEHAMIEVREDGRIVGFCESADKGRSSAADSDLKGNISSRVWGRPTTGETDTLNVVRVLVQAYKRMGERLLSPDILEAVEPADHVLRWEDDPARTLPVQVIRAVSDEKFYRMLARLRRIEEEGLEPTQIADRMHQGVKKKYAQLGEAACHDLVLALDATRISACCVTSVIESYRAQYSNSLASQSFKQVWLIGPTDTMSYRLA